ncbi:putative membrane protein [Peptoniphilus olsenii]|uniref:Membrane protein n=1 Tax=Peptoniphilus olsenii TaxID=411570 RepID=A0ABV2J8L0_9FIRM
MVINNGFTYIAFLMFLAGSLLAIQKYTGWKIFNVVPPLVFIYVLNMAFCTMGLYDSEACSETYAVLKNNLLYAMIFVMLLRCDFRKLAKLGGRMVTIFLACSFTLFVGTIVGYPIFKSTLGNDTWAAVAALYASWVGGSANMAAMQAALPVDAGAYSCALALDTVCYSLWIALLLLAVRYAPKWNKITKADTSKLQAVADAAAQEISKDKNIATSADWIFLIGLSLIVSAVSQYVGASLNNGLSSVGLEMFDKGTITTLFVTILGLICALSPLGKVPAVEELSNVYLYAVVSLLASTASIVDLLTAPMWVVFGLFILLVHVVLMFLFSKIFHWDLCMVFTASLANLGGSASAPIVASAYDQSYAGIGVLMGVLGAAVGNFLGIGIAQILRIM